MFYRKHIKKHKNTFAANMYCGAKTEVMFLRNRSVAKYATKKQSAKPTQKATVRFSNLIHTLMVTIIDALRNAAHNIESDDRLDQAIGQVQLKTAVKLLEAGFKPEDGAEEAHRKYEEDDDEHEET